MTDPTPSLDQKTIRTSPVLWLLGILFALFLGGLGTRGLSDAADLLTEPVASDFVDRLTAPLEAELERVNEQPDPRVAKIAAAEKDEEALQQAVDRGEESWRNWLSTRATLGGTSREDQQIRARRDQLDALRDERDQTVALLKELRSAPDPRQEARQAILHRINEARLEGSRQYAAAESLWRWRVLGLRLLLVLPVVAVALVLWQRRSRIKYVTLAWGYWAFALWMVLWGMGPYLPRYGGYAPLALGLAVTAWGAVTLARWLNSRLHLRRRRIVDQAIARHHCPGCDRDYLLGRETALDAGLARKARTLHYDHEALHPHHCAACGLALFAPCVKCQALRLVHTDHCGSCGASEEPQPAT
jgi:predicted RNA-binding Zn-ribbon protein involved in translation (DUF1610 family)